MYSDYYKRYVIVLLLAVYIFNRADTSIFYFLIEPIKEELKLSDTQLGFLAGPALVIFYGLLGIPVARLADRISRVNIMSVAVALWSAIVTLSSMVTSFGQFALARIGVGVGEAGFSAVAQSLISDYYRGAERTRAISIFMLGIPLGKLVSGLAAGWINQLYGWRAVFIVAGIPGIVLALLMKWTVREPRRGAIESGAQKAALPPLRTVFAMVWDQHTLRHLALAVALTNIVAFCTLAWTPAFFMRNHAMMSGEVGTWLAFVAGLGGSAGIWLGGYLTSRQRLTTWRARLNLMAFATVLVTPLLVLALWIAPKELAMMALLAGYVLTFFFFAPSVAFVQELAGASRRATLASIFILIQTVAGGVLGVQMLGILSDALTALLGDSALGLRWSMTLTAFLAVWAALHFALAARAVREDSKQSS